MEMILPVFCISCDKYVVLEPGAAHMSRTVVFCFGFAISAARQLALSCM